MYNPTTNKAIDIEEIARQCKEAITRGRVPLGRYSPDNKHTLDQQER